MLGKKTKYLRKLLGALSLLAVCAVPLGAAAQGSGLKTLFRVLRGTCSNTCAVSELGAATGLAGRQPPNALGYGQYVRAGGEPWFEYKKGDHVPERSDDRIDVYKLGDGQNADIFRIVPKARPEGSYVEKTFYRGGDRYFEAPMWSMLREAARSVNVPGVRTVRQRRWRLHPNRVTQFEDVQGHTLSDVLDDGLVPEEVAAELRARFREFNVQVERYLRNQYQDHRTIEFYNKPGELVDVWMAFPLFNNLGYAFALKERNVIVDHQTLEIVIIDPD